MEGWGGQALVVGCIYKVFCWLIELLVVRARSRRRHCRLRTVPRVATRFEFYCPECGFMDTRASDDTQGFPEECPECGLLLRLRVLERRGAV